MGVEPCRDHHEVRPEPLGAGQEQVVEHRTVVGIGRPEVLGPLAGRFAVLLYTIGILGVGLLAIPTLSGSAAYALAETLNWREGLDEKLGAARAFYAVVIGSTAAGLILDFANINPLRALFWTAVINGTLAPFLLVGILVVASDSKIMLGQPSSRLSRWVVGIAAAVMFAAGIAMFVA